MKKPYVKKYRTVSGFVVWIVDGNYIRNYIDEDFTNFGQHCRFRFIPKNEFWIDKDHSGASEEKYYIEHMLVENRLMAEGKTYGTAIDAADKVEKRERSKYFWLRKMGEKPKGYLLKKVRKRLLKKYSKNVNVWVVDGRLVRDLFYVDFTEGGHDLVYPFVPKNEIWLDDSISQKERKFILLHELYERNLMAVKLDYLRREKKRKLSMDEMDEEYEVAHWSAQDVEYYCRHNAWELDRMLKEEAKKAEKL